MQITYGSTVLVSGSYEGVVALRLNGDSITDEASFFRAAANTFFARGNKSTLFEFEAWWYFSSRGDAERFIMSHWASLAASDLLTITAGDGESGPTVYQLADACLKSSGLSEWKGTAVRWHYTFQGGLFASESIDPPDEGSTVKRGSVDLNPGDESAAIVFAASFGTNPAVVEAVVIPPTGGSIRFIDCRPLSDTITPTGFSAAFSFAIPEAGYKLFWVAYAS